MSKNQKNEDECCARRCFDDGEAFCAVCDGWYCLDHLELLVGDGDTPAQYVCGVCSRESNQDNQATLSRLS